MRVAAVCLVRNATLLDFPVEAAIASVRPLADVVVVNAGLSADDTVERLKREFAGDPAVRLLVRAWDDGRGGAMLADETNAALDCVADCHWAVYVQADEVLHEETIEPMRLSMQAALGDPAIDGLLVDFVHHYGDPDTIATSRLWYRREVRVIRPGRGVCSHHHAQGFRREGRRLRASPSLGRYHHYGWVRPVAALTQKLALDRTIYGSAAAVAPHELPWEFGLRPFDGTHPRAVGEWLAARSGTHASIGRPRWTARQLRLAASHAAERALGRRIFEYRNYELASSR